MLKHFFDTIIAPITGIQKAAVAVLRISGPNAKQITSKIFLPWPENIEPKKLIYGQFLNGDDGYAVFFKEGASYTGEASVELSIHGSPASVKSLLNLACMEGARLAQPGEFTQRAFLNGRIDLTQAEGVRETIESLTESQLRAASQLREGILSKKIQAIREEILGVLAAVEASIDFSEEIGELDRNLAVFRIQNSLKNISDILKTANASKILREGLKIALIGLPNAGKSSLFNALLGINRAIVTDIPGTTRDTVEELVDLGGIPCWLIDTAGLRQTEDVIEKMGVDRAHQAVKQADMVWYIYDSQIGWTEHDDRIFSEINRPVEIIANKSDLEPNPKRGRPISTFTRDGLSDLINLTKEHASIQENVLQVCINARHESLLQKAYESLCHVITTLESSLPEDLASVGLSQAAQSLGEIIGQTATPDIIHRIFHDFCIGK